MTDEEFVFNQTVKERKSIGRGAFHKKGGAKKCTLPSDYLTPAQKKKLTVPTVTWRMNAFYSYPEFKAMPDDIQEAYLVTIIKKYKVGITAIATALFGVTGPALYAYMSKKEYYKRLINITEKHSLAENINNFKNAISLTSFSSSEKSEVVVNHEDEQEVKQVEQIEGVDHFEIEASLSFTELVSFISNLSSSKKIKMKLIIDAAD